MFYSNSNIDTVEEFERRREGARHLAEAEGVPLVADEYDHAAWLREVASGLEGEPEKGLRCAKCFRFSLGRTARYAAEHGYDAFATSLTVSPHKASPVVFKEGDAAASDNGGSSFLHEDFKKRDGFKLSVRRAAELGLYRQSYCGCEFSKAVVAGLFAATLAAGAAARPAQPAELRVGSYNIRYERGDRGTENAWEERRDDLAALIRKMDLDVVGLQEVEPCQAAFLTNALPGYALVGEFRNADRKSGEASPVMYRKSRFAVEASGSFWLSETPDAPGSRSWDTACTRICTWARLVDKASGRTFAFANTHTDHASSLARREGMKLIVESRLGAIAPNGTPVVLTGDHNCLETEEAARIAARRLGNALYLSETPPEGPWRSLNCWRWKDAEVPCSDAWKKSAVERNARIAAGGPFVDSFAFGGPRIDYIYVSPGTRVKSYATYADARPGKRLYPSDHFPVAATVVLGGEGRAPASGMADSD